MVNPRPSSTTLADKTATILKEWLRCLVDHPGQVRVSFVESGRLVVFVVTTHPDDLHWLSEHHRKLLDALERLVQATGVRYAMRYQLNVEEVIMIETEEAPSTHPPDHTIGYEQGMIKGVFKALHGD